MITWKNICPFLLTGVLLCGYQSIFGQVKVQLNVTVLQGGRESDSIFLAGNFNGWNPSDTNFLFKNNGHQYSLYLDSLPAGQLSFKCTRGSWNTVECKADGHSIDNRLVECIRDTSIFINIEGWKDRTVYIPRHTATAQVHVFSDSIFLPQLNRYRLLRIYLPENYQASKKRYPVLYMHDGQNLFDVETTGYGEWGVDECLDSLIRQGHPPCIVVGVDNGPERINEYLPFDSEEYGKAKGDLYLSDLAGVIKPYVDKRYRTLKDRENTIIAGSSLGGLISYYALLKYPSVFGHAGIFSPSFWIAPEIRQMTDSLGSRVNGKCFFYIGGLEGERYKADMVAVADKLGERSSAIMYSVIDPLGIHREAYWRKWFPEFYIWMMGNGFNRQVKTKH